MGLLRKLSSAAFAVLIAAAVALDADAQGTDVTCAYVRADPPGPRGNRVEITQASAKVWITRRGERIVFRHADDSLRCAGPTPTIENIDEIGVGWRAARTLRVDLSNGHLAPGASESGRGADIEILMRAPRGAPTLTGATVVSGRRANGIVLGRIVDRQVVNLNQRRERRKDADLHLGPVVPGISRISILPRGGGDVIDARGLPAFAPSDLRAFFFGGGGADRIYASRASGRQYLIGGAGGDLLIGSTASDPIRGRQGADRIFARGGPDGIQSNGGRDRVSAGPGDDRVSANDGVRDDIDCGGGTDFARVDGRDRHRRCEQVTRI
jgi:RTX calcium-binding nonapeptide repeat (4 copies)